VAVHDQQQLQAALGSHYTLERELGRGGMATVYLARDTKHQRLVALKVIHPDLAATLGPERFRREIATAAQLHHPHMLGVLDSGETPEGQLWFTMPYVEGETLRDRMRRDGQLSIDDAIRITREVASALDYAHQHAVIHRDIKPENILLTTQGDAVLADFGVAQAIATGTTDVSGAPSLTATGLAIGTPQYMSPEQASGQRTLDARSDVYALGAVLYEMLAGEPPFTGPTAQAIIARLLTSEPPSICKLRPSVPSGVDIAIRRALAPVPLDRWTTAGDFARELDSAQRATLSGTVPTRKRVPATALALAFGFLVGVGALFAWRSRGVPPSPTPAASPSSAVRLAVLPFENEGDSADGYFADGMTEAVHDKLTSVPGIEVVGSASSRTYRGTTKTPQQIGQELGVRYLLEGHVRWAKGAAGASRVRVSPELVDVASGSSKWAQPFDAPLTDVFQVQGDIAGKVTQSLAIALTPAAQQVLAEQPTANLAAYDSYLRGLSLLTLGNAPIQLHRSVDAFREAVALDSTFALAWSRLGVAYGLLYYNGIPSRALADSADRATAKALALAPNLPGVREARARYYSNVGSDYASALAQADSGLAHTPTPELLAAAASAEESLGHWEKGASLIAKAVALDPLNAVGVNRAANLAMRRRRSAEARAGFARAEALSPATLNFYQGEVAAALQAGDLAGARQVIRAAPPVIDRASLVAYVSQYADLGWSLDSANEALLLRLRPDAFDDDTADWAFGLAQQYGFRGDKRRSRAYADTALRGYEEQLKLLPNDDQRHTLIGLSLAYLGRTEEAIREGKRGVALRPSSKDAVDGPYNEHQLVRIYILTGQPERALDLLERLIQEPYWLSHAWLKIDPNFAPLRGNPRFDKLLATPDVPID
jgi:eukaryotic-like serine/threonine-protein kinase